MSLGGDTAAVCPAADTLDRILERIRENGSPFSPPLKGRTITTTDGSVPAMIWLARLDRHIEDKSWLVVLDKRFRPVYWEWPWDAAAVQRDSMPDAVRNNPYWEAFHWRLDCMPDNEHLYPWYQENGYQQ